MQGAPHNTWLDEAVRLQPRSGRARYLIGVKEEKCGHCSTGTRTLSIWTTALGQGETVAWCEHCFNATCESLKLDEEYKRRLQRVQVAIAEGRVSQPWRAARPALEDLRRRGLL